MLQGVRWQDHELIFHVFFMSHIFCVVAIFFYNKSIFKICTNENLWNLPAELVMLVDLCQRVVVDNTVSPNL